MEPIVFSNIQNLVLYSLTIFALGIWAGGAIVFKIATAINNAKESSHKISLK